MPRVKAKSQARAQECPSDDRESPDGLPSLAADPLFLQFLESNGGAGLDPLSAEALELQARYVREVGDHPLDVLKTISRNPFLRASDRVAAAKALLEYGLRKVPSGLEIGGPGGAPLSGLRLSALTDAELAALTALLDKARSGA